MFIRMLSAALIFTGFSSFALVQKVTFVKKNAFFKEAPNAMFEPLDLRRKKITFKKPDIEECRKKMIRVKDTLHYTCLLPIPNSAKIVKRQNQITPVIMTVPYAGADRRVFITVSDDASAVQYSTEFDMTGFDLEVAKFNDDFYRVYGKTALEVIGTAMAKSLQIEVLEGRGKKSSQRTKG